MSARTRLSPRLAGLLAALLMAALLQAVGPDRASRSLFDFWQRLAPRDLSDTDVRIVWIDEKSFAEYGAWPWPRHVLTQLTAHIADADPKAIGFDMFFPERDRVDPASFAGIYTGLSASAKAEIAAQTSTDSGFAQMIGQAPVVLARAGEATRKTVSEPAPAVEARFEPGLPESVRSWERAIVNIPGLDIVAAGHGLINGEPDSDGVVRRVPLVGRVAGSDNSGFALELARLAMNEEVIAPLARDGKLSGIRLGRMSLPAERDGSMRLRLGPFPRAATVSADDVIAGGVDPALFRGKIVLIGLNGAGTADVVSTPLAAKVYGTEVQANAVDAILNGETLERPRWAWVAEAILTILLIGIAVRVLPRLRAATATLVTVGAIPAFFAWSFAAFSIGGLLLDPLGPLLTAGAAGATMLVLLFGEARRQRAQLALTLQEERVVAAKAAGEIEAARTIQLGMLPPREGLAGFDKAVELDALIEPARSVGGDFYDAIRIDATHVCFLVGDVTGKGVPAALFMALSKALTKSVLLRDGHDLGAAVTRLNDEIARDNSEDMFVTMVFGLLDTANGALSLCCAGHEKPWLAKPGGVVTRLDPAGGPPLSVVPGFVYAASEMRLSPGDAIVFVSDGITEAQNPGGGFFGSERLKAVLQKTVSEEPTVDALLREVRLFENGAEATDDLTVLTFRYTGPDAI